VLNVLFGGQNIAIIDKSQNIIIFYPTVKFSIFGHQKPASNRYYRTYPDPEPEEDVVTLECAHGCVISTRSRGHHFFTKANGKCNVSEKNRKVNFKIFCAAVKKC
jgi:hypothetical protein